MVVNKDVLSPDHIEYCDNLPTVALRSLAGLIPYLKIQNLAAVQTAQSIDSQHIF